MITKGGGEGTMMHNMVHASDHLPIDDITSPLGAQLLEFCESDLFPETLQNSEVASSSNCCYEEQSSYEPHPSMTTNIMSSYNDNSHNNTGLENEIPTAIVNSNSPSTPIAMPESNIINNEDNNKNMSIIFHTTDDQLENDISASIDFTTPTSFSLPIHHQYLNQTNNNQEHFNISSLGNQLSLGDFSDGTLQYESIHGLAAPHQPGPGMLSMLGPSPIPTGYDDECGLPSYIRMRTSMDPIIAPYLTHGSMNAPPFSGDSSAGMFGGSSLMMGSGLSHQDLEFHGDNGGLFLPDNMSRVFNNELQAMSSESQHLVHGGGSGPTHLATEISSLEDPTFKVGKLSAEERKRKIHRYMKKRNERNFSKKIKYACRKTLADSRPRVRGRFAKNDEQGEMARTNGSNHDYDDADEDGSLYSSSMPDHQHKVGVKEEEDLDSDIFAHITGLNSLKCSYPIQSWI